MDMLKTPVMIHQFHRKPIQKFRMTWRLALRTQVLGRRHQAGPEVRLPNAIDDRAGCRRRATIGEPTCEFETAGRRTWSSLSETRIRVSERRRQVVPERRPKCGNTRRYFFSGR